MSNRNTARWMVLLCILHCILHCGYAPTHADESTAATLPTEAGSVAVVYVSTSRGELRSGPSEEFYPTDYLSRGTSLEVHHRTNDNWLGVRPPEGSFSWVPAADAYLLPGGKVVEIISPSAVSWIGTSLGSAKQYRWQVKLKQGEQLGVLGEQSTQTADGKEILWYKIAPPSGEFRWIHAKTVSSVPLAADEAIVAKRPPNSQSQVRVASQVKPQAEASRQKQSRTAQAAEVVTAAYQKVPTEGAIFLGPGDDYYDGGPLEGDIIYEGEGVDGQIIEGEVLDDGYVGDGYVGDGYIDEGYIDGQIIDGQIIDGQIVDGEIIYEDDGFVAGSYRSGSNDPFAGWHAMDLGDDGMRFTWLERLYTRARQRGPDRLAADPFDLSMTRGTVRPNSEAAYARMAMAGDLYEPRETVTEQRRGRGWRDPRTLRGKRSGLSGIPVAAPEVSSTNGNADTALGLAGNTPPLATGLERVAGVLTSARSALTHSPTPLAHTAQLNAPALNTNTGLTTQSPTANVNWYGIPTNVNPATAASAVAGFDLSQLQLMLSEMVTQPMHLWNLQNIYDSAKHTVEHGGSPVERGQARLLLERVEEFAELAQRSGYLALTRTTIATPSPTASSSVMMAGASSGMAAAPGVVSSEFQSTFSGAANYDASGWLVPVIAASPGQPTHALTDETGRILSYVTAMPGLNLDRYVNQAVGVTGLRGYLPQLQAGHVQAQRVVRVQ